MNKAKNKYLWIASTPVSKPQYYSGGIFVGTWVFTSPGSLFAMTEYSHTFRHKKRLLIGLQASYTAPVPSWLWCGHLSRRSYKPEIGRTCLSLFALAFFEFPLPCLVFPSFRVFVIILLLIHWSAVISWSFFTSWILRHGLYSMAPAWSQLSAEVELCHLPSRFSRISLWSFKEVTARVLLLSNVRRELYIW